MAGVEGDELPLSLLVDIIVQRAYSDLYTLSELWVAQKEHGNVEWDQAIYVICIGIVDGKWKETCLVS